MTKPFKITEADVGKKFRLRKGDVVEVIALSPEMRYPVLSSAGEWYTAHGLYSYSGISDPLDIVEKLPDEETIEPTLDTPLLEASDGNLYPVEWFAVQQRFDDVTPPEGAERIHWANGVVWQPLKISREEYWRPTHWTLAPIPPKAKEEPNVWDEDLDGKFFVLKSYSKMDSWYIHPDPSFSDVREQQIRLRDFLNHHFPKANPND